MARDCLSKAQGDKLHAMRLYMQYDRKRPGRRAEGDRVEHGAGLVTGETLVERPMAGQPLTAPSRGTAWSGPVRRARRPTRAGTGVR